MANSADNGDWLETVVAQWETRQVSAQILLHTIKFANGLKEHHVKLFGGDDECFLYRTVINTEEYRRLALSNSFIASFDNVPQYLRQLLRAAEQENEYGQSYYVNIVSDEMLGIAPRVELLITTRHANSTVHNNVLNVPFMSASDAEFKEYLTSRFETLRKEKEQLRRSASFLESQLIRERTRNRELEDKNTWLRKELKFTQNLLKSAESIQKHYEVILSVRHRGETGSTVVTIGDVVTKASNTSSQDSYSAQEESPGISGDPAPTSTAVWSPSTLPSTSFSFSSPIGDEDCRSKTYKRKVSMCNATDTDSESENEGCRIDSMDNGTRKNPPPRKYAAAVLQLDDKLMMIRKQQEQGKKEISTGQVTEKLGNVSRPTQEETDQRSPLLPSPMLAKAMSPPALVLPIADEAGESGNGSQGVNNDRCSVPSTVSLVDVGRMVQKSDSASTDTPTIECPGDSN